MCQIHSAEIYSDVKISGILYLMLSVNNLKEKKQTQTDKNCATLPTFPMKASTKYKCNFKGNFCM